MTIQASSVSSLADRLASYLPTNWFDVAEFQAGTLTHAVLSAFATNDLHDYDYVRMVEQQLTLVNAVGSQVDDIVRDYFGNNLPRVTNESDAAYSARAVTKLFTPTGTRPALIAAIERLGTPYLLLENQHAATSGPWRAGYDLSAGVGQVAYDTAGVYDAGTAAGIYAGAHQALLTVHQPEPTDPKFMTRLQIMALIAEQAPVGTIIWVRLIGPNSTGGVPIG